jgi:hypothetical protein
MARKRTDIHDVRSWCAEVAYKKGTMVYHSLLIFIATKDSIGVEPVWPSAINSSWNLAVL